MKDHEPFKCPEGDKPCDACDVLAGKVSTCNRCTEEWYCHEHLALFIAVMNWGAWMKRRDTE